MTHRAIGAPEFDVDLSEAVGGRCFPTDLVHISVRLPVYSRNRCLHGWLKEMTYEYAYTNEL